MSSMASRRVSEASVNGSSRSSGSDSCPPARRAMARRPRRWSSTCRFGLIPLPERDRSRSRAGRRCARRSHSGRAGGVHRGCGARLPSRHRRDRCACVAARRCRAPRRRPRWPSWPIPAGPAAGPRPRGERGRPRPRRPGEPSPGPAGGPRRRRPPPRRRGPSRRAGWAQRSRGDRALRPGRRCLAWAASACSRAELEAGRGSQVEDALDFLDRMLGIGDSEGRARGQHRGPGRVDGRFSRSSSRRRISSELSPSSWRRAAAWARTSSSSSEGRVGAEVAGQGRPRRGAALISGRSSSAPVACLLEGGAGCEAHLEGEVGRHAGLLEGEDLAGLGRRHPPAGGGLQPGHESTGAGHGQPGEGGRPGGCPCIGPTLRSARPGTALPARRR